MFSLLGLGRRATLAPIELDGKAGPPVAKDNCFKFVTQVPRERRDPSVRVPDMKGRNPYALFVLSLPLVSASCAYWADANGAEARASSPAVAAADEEPTAPEVATGANGEGAVTLRLRGSNTVGSSLAPRLALAFLTREGATDAAEHDEQKAQDHITVTGTVSGHPVTFVIDAPGTKVAFECLADSSCDIGMASRPVSVDEAARLAALGDMTSPAAEHVIAMDGVAVVVNRANRVSKLTVAQLEGLFEGSIRDWSQVDGASGEVHPYIRDKKSGTYDTFIQFVTRGRDLPTDKAKVADSDGIAAGVASDENGVGFLGLAYVQNNKAVAIQDGDSLPLGPTPFTVATEDYAFSRRLYFYTPTKGVAPMTAKFIEFAQSDEGQKEVDRVGFVGLNLTAAPAAPPSSAPADYLKAVQGARRLSVAIHFRRKAKAMALDGKAQADLDRMARYIKATSSDVHQLALIGFTDNQGGAAGNVALSTRWAQTVADLLKRRGVNADIIDGFGSAVPVAPNDSTDGRSKNRRVEVWLR